MFETASSDAGERPVIDLEESAEVLERLLGYCYPQLAPRWVYAAERDQTFVAAIDKYHVSGSYALAWCRAHLAL